MDRVLEKETRWLKPQTRATRVLPRRLGSLLSIQQFIRPADRDPRDAGATQEKVAVFHPKRRLGTAMVGLILSARPP